MRKIILLFVLFLLFSLFFVYARTIVAEVEIIEDSELPSVHGGKSILYYLKVINKNLITTSLSQAPTREEIFELGAIDTIDISPPSDRVISNKSIKKIIWNNLVDLGNNSITFNKVKFNGGEHTLSIILLDDWRSWWGHRAIEVKVDGKTVDCQKKWGVPLNLATKRLVLSTWGDQSEVCKEQIGSSEYVLNVSNFSKPNGKFSMTLESPLIPNNCPAIISGNKGLLSPAC